LYLLPDRLSEARPAGSKEANISAIKADTGRLKNHSDNIQYDKPAKRMKYLITILFLATCSFEQAQTTVLTTDPSLPIPKFSFDEKGDLKITASATSSPSDFDFLVGKWKMHNRRLNKRLENCKDWTEFDSFDENWKILSGTADTDIYSTTEMPGQEGKRFEGLTLRLFKPH
jgi:hypothetical protein